MSEEADMDLANPLMLVSAAHHREVIAMLEELEYVTMEDGMGRCPICWTVRGNPCDTDCRLHDLLERVKAPE